MLITERRPTALLVLASLLVLLSMLDHTLVLSEIPMLRNPAALAALMLVLCFFIFRIKHFQITSSVQLWTLGFLVLTLIVQLLRIVVEGRLPSAWLLNYLQWVQMLVLFFILLDLAKDPRAFHYFGISFLLAVLYISFSALLAPEGFAVGDGQRLGYEGANLNQQGYWYAMATLALIWWLIERWPKLDLLSVLLFLLAGFEFYCLLRTGSRGAFLAMLVGLSCLFIIGFRREKLSAYLMLIPIMLLASIWVILRNDLVVERLFMVLEGTQDGSRSIIFSAGWDLFLERPFIGYGMEFYELLGNKFGKARLAVHNSFLRVVLNFGIFAGIVWLGLIVSVMWRCWKARNGSVGVLFLSLILLSMVFGNTTELQFDKFFWLMLALASQAPLYGMLHDRHRLEVCYDTAASGGNESNDDVSIGTAR